MKNIFFAGLALILSACSTSYQAAGVVYDTYSIDTTLQRDSALVRLIKPYADSVHKSMNGVIARTAITLNRAQPESTLGNVVADAIFQKGQQMFDNKVDGAIMNQGGIRLTSLAKGDITLGKVYELAPFDNTLVLLHVPGNVLQAWCDHVSSLNGWPVANITWEIKNKKAENIKIAGVPLNPQKVYNMLTNDYVANGGDNCDMLRPLPRVTNGYLLRDAVIDYLVSFTRKGLEVNPKIETRITNAE